MVRLLCFAKSGGDAPSTRQRVLGLIDVAQAHEWETTLVMVRALSWWNILPLRFVEFFRFLTALRTVDRETVVLLQRTLRRPEFLWLMQVNRQRIPYIISDFDDAVWTHRPSDMDEILKLSDEVWCGSRTVLAYCAERHAHAKFVPTTLETERFSLTRNEESVPVIGWVGDVHAHKKNLKFFSDILRAIHADLPPFQFRLIGITAFEKEIREWFDFLGGRLQIVGWTPPEAIPQYISRFSIGIMPLEKNEFNEGKSALKLLEYLAAGMPVIASDVGENRYVVRAPEFGRLATTADEWKSALQEMLGDTVGREAMGKRGQSFVRSDYDRKHVYGHLLRELQSRFGSADSGRLHDA